MLQNKIVGLGDDILCFRTGVNSADIIQVILPQLYGKYRSKTALEDGLHLGKMMVLELKLGILDPVSGLLCCSRRQGEGGIPNGKRRYAKRRKRASAHMDS